MRILFAFDPWRDSILLVAGVLWLIMSLIVFRMDLSTVYAISILFGIVAIADGIDEFLSMAAVHGGWKWLHGILGVIFVVAGIVALANPDWTFLALASRGFSCPGVVP